LQIGDHDHAQNAECELEPSIGGEVLHFFVSSDPVTFFMAGGLPPCATS
jgi:hypothetical protein